MTVIHQPLTKNEAWPAPWYDAWRQAFVFAGDVYSDEERVALAVGMIVNAYIEAGAPENASIGSETATSYDAHYEVWQIDLELVDPSWDGFVWAEKESSADVVIAAVSWAAGHDRKLVESLVFKAGRKSAKG